LLIFFRAYTIFAPGEEELTTEEGTRRFTERKKKQGREKNVDGIIIMGVK